MKCCKECFLPERDGPTFYSHAAGYALPEGCKDEECECHKDIPAALEQVDKQVGGALRRLGGMEPEKECVCGNPSSRDAVHRTDGPCYQKKPAPWEEVFDKDCSFPGALCDLRKETQESLKSFIRSEIAAAEKRGREMAVDYLRGRLHLGIIKLSDLKEVEDILEAARAAE